MKCEVSRCQRTAEYALFALLPYAKMWLHVCKVHDNYFGLRNLEASGMTRQEARQFEGELRETNED